MRSIVICWLLAAIVGLSMEPALAATADQSPAEPASETIPFKQQPAVGSGTLQRVAIVLLLAIGVSIVAALLLRKELGKRGLLTKANSDRITVVASRRLAPRLTVFLINVDDQAYVLVQSGNETQLSRHQAAAPAAAEG